MAAAPGARPAQRHPAVGAAAAARELRPSCASSPPPRLSRSRRRPRGGTARGREPRRRFLRSRTDRLPRGQRPEVAALGSRCGWPARSPSRCPSWARPRGCARLGRRATILDSPAWSALASDIALSLARAPRAPAPGRPRDHAHGLGRAASRRGPSPRTPTGWSESQRRAVLTHEMAHVEAPRLPDPGDRARGVLGLLVPPPGLARRATAARRARARLRRSRAARGASGPDYADQLLQLAPERPLVGPAVVDGGSHGAAVAARGPPARDPRSVPRSARPVARAGQGRGGRGGPGRPPRRTRALGALRVRVDLARIRDARCR